ncbi:hypothetical protein BDZ89DRAFT_1059476 [Hymenopellis radicata]|nr:hypothetical protein BDZ89DRAFT_1059476 [Hymenopellis radicata]
MAWISVGHLNWGKLPSKIGPPFPQRHLQGLWASSRSIQSTGCMAVKVDEPPPIPVGPAPPTVDVVEVIDVKPSPFTALRLVHIHILSFLPRSALLSVIRVSQQMRTVCRPILYADPLSVVLPPLDSIDRRYSSMFDLALQNYMPRLVESLVSNPSMSKFLRCLHVAVPALDFWGAEKASWLKDLLGDIWLQDVRELWIYPTYLTKHPSSTDSGPGQEYRHGLYELARLFPGLSTLHLIAVVRSTLLLDPVEEVEHTRALPPLWNSLRHLTVHLAQEPFYLDVYRRMIASSASTLQSLHIHTPDALLIEEDEWRRFLVCPNLRELTIFHQSPGLQALLLRCFPRLISLDMKRGPVQRDTLDLSVSAPRLEHVQFTTMFLDTGLPSTIKTVSVRHRIFCEVGGGRLGRPEAVFFGKGLVGKMSDNVRFVGEAWPGLLSLEIGGSVDVEELRSLIATHLPRLEILILSWSEVSAQRRIDYPVDDGFDEEQRRCAARFFETCKGLGVISFNGIPREDKKGKVPDRVWTRWRLSEEERGGRYTANSVT